MKVHLERSSSATPGSCVSALVKTAALLACGGLAGCFEWRPSKSTSAYLLGSGAIERAEAEDAAADMYATVENIRSLNELTDEAAVLLEARGDRLDATTRARLAGSIATVEQMAVRNTNLLKLESAGVRSRAERQRLVREGLAQPAFREAMEVLISFNQTTKAGLRSESDATAAELETLETEVASEAQALGVPSSTASIEQRIAALENSLAEGSSGLSQQQDRLIRELEAEQSDLQSQIDDIEPAWRFHADLRRRHKYVPGSDFDTLSNNPYRRVRRERVWLMEEENLPSWEKKAPDREFLEYHEDYFVINPKEPPPFRDPGEAMRSEIRANANLSPEQRTLLLQQADSYTQAAAAKYTEEFQRFNGFQQQLATTALTNRNIRQRNEEEGRRFLQRKLNQGNFFYWPNWTSFRYRFEKVETLPPPPVPTFSLQPVTFPGNPFAARISQLGQREGAVNRDLILLRNAKTDAERQSVFARLETRNPQLPAVPDDRSALQAELTSLRQLKVKLQRRDALQSQREELAQVAAALESAATPEPQADNRFAGLDSLEVMQTLDDIRGTAGAVRAVDELIAGFGGAASYTFENFDITFWDALSQREAFTGTPLAPATAGSPRRFSANSSFDSTVEESVILTAAAVENRLPMVSASYLGTLKHYYRFNFNAFAEGRGAVYLNFTSRGTGIGDLSGGFSLQDSDGTNLFSADELQEFTFEILQVESGATHSASILVGGNNVGSVDEVTFYGADGESAAGRFNIQGYSSFMPLSQEGSFESFGIFGAETP